MQLFIPTHMLHINGVIEPLFEVERAKKGGGYKTSLLTYDEWDDLRNEPADNYHIVTKYELVFSRGKYALLTRDNHTCNEHGDCVHWCKSCSRPDNYLYMTNIELFRSFNKGGTKLI